MTIEGKRERIKHYCIGRAESGLRCAECPLIGEVGCFEKDETIDRNYAIVFGNDADKPKMTNRLMNEKLQAWCDATQDQIKCGKCKLRGTPNCLTHSFGKQTVDVYEAVFGVRPIVCDDQVDCPTAKGVSPDAPTVTNEQGGMQSKTEYAFHLIDTDAILALAEVLQIGANKYARDNWRKIPPEEHFNHLLIHYYAWLKGDKSDDHLGHLLCRAMMLYATGKADKG